MDKTQHQTDSALRVPPRLWTIGCVSYLNAKPLIQGIDAMPGLQVRFDVPSSLIVELESGRVDIALCPVIDYYRSPTQLDIVPAGGIGCFGPTLTVRLYSRVPLSTIKRVHVDSDSHTSVVLLRVILAQMYSIHPELITSPMPGSLAANTPTSPIPESMLLIGDKIVSDSPPETTYPHQMDLGEAWMQMTGLPFVFAVWMARRGVDLDGLPDTLNRQRLINSQRIDQLVEQFAHTHRWPADLAYKYLTQHIKYDVGQPQFDAIERFATAAHALGLIDHVRPLHVRSLKTPTRQKP